MDRRSHKLLTTAELVGGLAVFRMALPAVLTWIANAAAKKVPGYRASVDRIDLKLRQPSVTIRGIRVDGVNRQSSGQSVRVGSLTVGSEWRRLLHGSLATFVNVRDPRVMLDLAEIKEAKQTSQASEAKSHEEKPAPSHPPNGKPSAPSWQNKVKQLPPFIVSPVNVLGGELHVAGIPGQDGTDVQVRRLNVSVQNITNTPATSGTALAQVAATAQVMRSGDFAMRAEGYPFAEEPTFNADASVRQVDLTEFKPLLAKYADVDLQNGIADLFVEAAAAKGKVNGYAKPVFDHLRMESLEHRGFSARAKAAALKAVARLGRNKPKDRIATRLDFDGSLDDPDLHFVGAVQKFIRNAFITAERASIDHRISFRKAGPVAADAEVQFFQQKPSRIGQTIGLLKESAVRWSSDGAPRMSAALAYYTAFSIAPLLLLAIAIAGLVLGRDAVQGKIVEEIGGMVGSQSAHVLQSMIAAAYKPSKGIIATIISVISILAGATGVFSELKAALNTIWRTQEGGDFKEVVKRNAALAGMVLGMGFLLAVSLLINTALSAARGYVSGTMPSPEIFLHIIDFVVSTAVISGLFAAIYKTLPNTYVEWRDVWIGAILTALLFDLGKLGLGFYLGRGAVGSSYGAAGSVLIVLLWVYYSGLIFYFGAEVTALYSARYGSRTRRKHQILKPA